MAGALPVLAIEFGAPTLDLGAPGVLGDFIDLSIQALQERIREGRAAWRFPERVRTSEVSTPHAASACATSAGEIPLIYAAVTLSRSK